MFLWSEGRGTGQLPLKKTKKQGEAVLPNKYFSAKLVYIVSYGPRFSPIDLWSACFALGPFNRPGKTRKKSTNRENEVTKIFIRSLLCTRRVVYLNCIALHCVRAERYNKSK